MNRRIRRKKAKQLQRAAAEMSTASAKLAQSVRALPITGPFTQTLRDRALFRSRRYQVEADLLLFDAVSLAG